MGLIRAVPTSTLCLGATCMIANRDTVSSIEARSGWTFLGCYTDNVSGRALPNSEAVSGGSSAMTIEACENACLTAGFSIASTEYAGECWGGDAIVNGGSPASDGSAGCSMACKGNAAETCGGPNRLDVYSYGSGGSPTTTTAASPSATAGNPLPGWNFLGCYKDNVSERTLPVMEAVSGGTTNEGCQKSVKIRLSVSLVCAMYIAKYREPGRLGYIYPRLPPTSGTIFRRSINDDHNLSIF